MAENQTPSETLPIFHDDELLNNVISSFSSSSSDNDVVLPLTPLNPDTIVKPIDDSRKLFQRLWTDNDEIHLLRSFLDYSISRGNVHHHDSTAFYDLIKNDFQAEFNKSQIVEKLRRLKKKCRTVLTRVDSGQKFLFKSSHDQQTFELSRRIWFSNVQFDDISQNPNPSFGGGLEKLSARKRQKVVEKVEDRVIASNDGDNDDDTVNFGGGLEKLSPRKRQKVVEKVEDRVIVSNDGDNDNDNDNGTFGGGLEKLSLRRSQKVVEKVEDGVIRSNDGDNDNDNVNGSVNDDVMNDINVNNVAPNADVSLQLQGLVEETLRNCISSVLKGVVNNVLNNASNVQSKGISRVSNVDGMKDEKWRKQQILELEVYSKRLELVQDQIKLSLEELRSKKSDCGEIDSMEVE